MTVHYTKKQANTCGNALNTCPPHHAESLVWRSIRAFNPTKLGSVSLTINMIDAVCELPFSPVTASLGLIYLSLSLVTSHQSLSYRSRATTRCSGTKPCISCFGTWTVLRFFCTKEDRVLRYVARDNEANVSHGASAYTVLCCRR